MSEGDPRAADRLLEVLYEDLHRVATALFRQERANHTLQPTALVHEAYLRLIHQDHITFDDEANFLALAATTVRRVLIDHVRKSRAEKRGGGLRRVTLSGLPQDSPMSDLDLLALDEALERLRQLDPRQAAVVELKFFGGMTDQAAAGVLGVSDRTVRGDWAHAKKWLKRELSEDSA
jgi:RNA polymerase sigma factor (TIGR02999 family)